MQESCDKMSSEKYLSLEEDSELNIYSAVSIAEGFDPVYTEEEYFAAWQFLIDTGACWRLQGWFGRTANHFIEQGLCQPPSNIRYARLIPSEDKKPKKSKKRKKLLDNHYLF
jgi:hypothetical protein